jgi:hypothetical protein
MWDFLDQLKTAKLLKKTLLHGVSIRGASKNETSSGIDVKFWVLVSDFN